MAKIDEMISMDRWEVFFKPEHKLGQPENPWVALGTETLLTQKNLENHYHALGNFLHVPTPKQVEKSQDPNLQKRKERCEKVVAILEKVLNSPISKVSLLAFTEMDCERCGHLIVRRLPLELKAGPINSSEKDGFEVRCMNCAAEYALSNVGSDKVKWTPKMIEFDCKTPNCKEKNDLWEDEIRDGFSWDCAGCGAHYAFALRLMREVQNESRAATATAGASDHDHC
jgi:hypothetical protein